jgi:lipid-binding SYLF domain-containing protein
MKHRITIYTGGLLLVGLMSLRAQAQIIATQNPTEITVLDSTTVFAQAMAGQDTQIPRSVLANAQGIAIVPGMVRGAFVVGLQYGKGVLVTRDPAGNWQAPRMIQMAGGSFGYQIGVQATDLILVFRTPQSVANVLNGTLKVGVDASAAAGPVGRQASAGTDIGLSAEILSYSRARGAFVGVSIDGSSISLDPQAEVIYYQPPGVFPQSAYSLLQMITTYAAVAPVAAPVAMAGAPGQVATTNGWVPAGTRSADTEGARQQLDSAWRQLSANPGLSEDWKRYLALPPDVSSPNSVPNPQAMQQALQHYQDVARQPQYQALTSRPEFQQALASLQRLSDARVASNTALQLPPPPR